MGAMIEGMIQEMTVLVSQGGAELVAMQAGVTNVGISVIEERIGQGIAAMPEVEDVSGVIWSANSEENMSFMFVFGLEPNARSMQHFRVIDGDPIRGRGEIMLGRAAADTLNKQVGDRMKLRGGVFRVTGIYESGLDYEEGGAVIALPDAQAVFEKPRQVTMIRIKLRDPSQAETVRAKIEERFRQDVSVSMASTFVEETANIRSTQAMLGAIFALAILVGSVAVTNTMVMAVLERTREIGTLRALGWRHWQVLWMILGESLLMCLVAAGVGVLVGLAITLGLRAVPGIGTSFKSLYTPQLIAQAVAVSLLLGTAGGLYPAWYASRLRPVEALRYE
jgi:putative ABC transport system permease protein